MGSADGNNALWIRLQDGDESAFTELYRIHATRVFNHCYRRTLSRQDAEDLTAETFAQAWRRRADIRLHTDVGGLPWLLITANNLLHRRRAALASARKLLGKVPAPEHAPDHALAITDQAETDQDLVLVSVVLKKLSRRDRDIIQLCLLDGLTPAQVAAVTGEPPGTVRSRLSRALVKARREYDRLAAALQQPTPVRNET
jgi:RNA polymerase sigma factor (sigma-70 family)